MTISGNGAIKEQAKASAYPWYKDRTKVKKLVLEEGVTNAPNSAFNGMTNLKTLEFPSTLAKWGTNVFQSSNNIESIRVEEGGTFSAENNILYGENQTRLLLSAKSVSGTVVLPATLKKIDANGLDGRGEITALTLPEGLDSIGDYAFRGLKKVEQLDIPVSVTSVGIGAFQNMEKLKTAEVPDGVTILSNNAFAGDKALSSVTLPAGLDSIGTNVFQNCTSLTSLEIPATVTSIGNNAFVGCSGMETLALPENLKTLGNTVFSGCAKLKSMTIPDGIKTLGTATNSSMFLNCSALESVVLPEGLTTIGASSFKGCSALKTIDIPDSVTTIGAMAFQQCAALKEVTVPEKVKELAGTFAGCTSLKKATLPEGLTAFKTGGSGASMVGAFTGCESLEEINVPAGVTSIERLTFSGCTGLRHIDLPKGLTSIGQNAFQNCTSLEEITIPSTVTTVMGGSFENCENLTTVRLAEGMTKFNTETKSATTAFKNCNRLTDLYLPDSLEEFNPITMEQADSIQRIHVSEDAHLAVEDGVLYDKALTKLLYIPASYAGKLVLPDTVVETGSRVAGYTHALTEIVFPEGFKSIGESAFYYADGLRSVTLPSTLETIGASGFRATGLREVDIPDSVTSVGTNAFTLCEKLTSAKIGEGLTKLPSAMFFNCHKLADISLPKTLTDISSQAFSGTCVSEITIPDGCETIGATALANNTNLNEVTLPASLTSIPSTAFNGDKALKSIYYKGTAEEWAKLNCKPAYGTVITDYKGVNTELAKAVIDSQPADAVYEKGAEAEPLQVTVKPTQEAGEQFFYTWYRNTSGKAEGGSTVEGTPIENGSSCIPSTDKIGTEYYYCVITRMVNGYTAERTVSDVVSVTIRVDLDGKGSEEEPFLVKTPEDLTKLYTVVKEGNSLAGVYIRMEEDVTLPANWESIGTLKDGQTSSAQGKNVNPFSGNFDGNGKTITVPENGKPLFGFVRGALIENLNIYGQKIDGTGLVDHYERDYETGTSQSEFGTDAKYLVTIRNVTLKAGTKTRESGLIGDNDKGSQDASSMNPVQIVNCKVEKGVEIGYNHDESKIGSLVGKVCGTVINCTSEAEVYGEERVGGIAGCQDVAMGILHVINSSFHGQVHATGRFAGGILGSGYERKSAPNALCVEIRNCHSDGTVEGKDYVGGIMGAEDTVAQCWGNGIGYIENNLFTGKITAASSARYIGGIVGYYRSLNKYTNFGNNHFAADCGAAVGIGGAEFVDTNAKHETDSGTTYFNTEYSVAGLPSVSGCDWKQGLNRTDDPFGADAPRLAACQDAETLNSAAFLSTLNDADTGMHNWVTGQDGKPCISKEPVCYKLEISGDFKTEYIIGEDFQTDGMEFTATWTDGRVTSPKASEISFRGFEKEKQAAQTIEATYGAATARFSVKVLKKDDGEPIEVSLVVLGDDRHGDKGEIHTNKMGDLQTWIEKKTYQVNVNDTAMDVLQSVLKANGYKAKVSGDYVAGLTKPDGETLREFSNGTFSGWMYTCNGVHPQLMLPEKYLEDGDELVFHYTDDYRLEEDALDVSDVKDLRKAIEALPAAADVSMENEKAIEEAAKNYDGLDELKAQLITKAQTEKLEEVRSALKVVKAKTEADEALNRANAAGQELEQANAEAATSAEAAAEAAQVPGRNAVSAARKAMKDAENAAAKAEAFAQAAEDAVAAYEEAVKVAEEEGDATTEASARALLEEAKSVQSQAKQSLEQANTAKAEAKAAQDQAILDKAAQDADLQEMKEQAIADLEDYVGQNMEAVDPDKAEVAVLKAVNKILEAESPEEINEAAQKGFDSVGKLIEEKAAADRAAAEKAEKELADKAASDKAFADLQKEVDKLVKEKAAAEKKKIEKQTKKALNLKVKKVKVKSKSRKIKVKWKKVKGAQGYQVQFKRSGDSAYKLLKVTKSKKVKTGKLKKRSRYTFRVRPYKKVNGQILYGKWTVSKTVRVK